MKSQSKHGKRADDQTTVTIPMPILLRNDLKALAKHDEDRELAPYLRIQLRKHVEENRALLDKLKAEAEANAKAQGGKRSVKIDSKFKKQSSPSPQSRTSGGGTLAV